MLRIRHYFSLSGQPHPRFAREPLLRGKLNRRMAGSGFTLIEIMITLVIFVMLAGVAIPAVGNIARVNLRSSASHASGMIKGTYDAAVLSGTTHRLLFDFAKRTMTPQVATGYVALTRGGDAQKKQEVKKKNEGKDDVDAQAAAILSIAKHITDSPDDKGASKATFQPMPGVKPYELPYGVHIADLECEHLRDPAKSGQEAIYFFPMGYSEHAVVHFEDDSGRVYGVEVEPLSGHTKVIDHRIDYKDEP